MTIAACYYSPEAVILGADSTTTIIVGNTFRHFNHAQKLFAVGPLGEATLGVVTWGMAEVGSKSHRTLISRLDRELMSRSVNSVQDAAVTLAKLAWDAYANSPAVLMTKQLDALPNRTPDQEKQYQLLKANLVLGYCIGGTWSAQNTPQAFEVLFDPLMASPPAPVQLTSGHFKFWGCPNMIDRVLYGIDGGLLASIRSSPLWTGTPQDLDALVRTAVLNPPDHVPLREAVDFINAAIYTTIRAFKFSQFPMVCGGPIEIAAVTSDRPFRWVRHKRLDEALD